MIDWSTILNVALGGLIAVAGQFISSWLSDRRARRERQRERMARRLEPVWDYLGEALTTLHALAGTRTGKEIGIPIPAEELTKLDERMKKLAWHPAGGWAAILILDDAKLREEYIGILDAISATASALAAGGFAPAIVQATAAQKQVIAFSERLNAWLDRI